MPSIAENQVPLLRMLYYLCSTGCAKIDNSLAGTFIKAYQNPFQDQFISSTRPFQAILLIASQHRDFSFNQLSKLFLNSEIFASIVFWTVRSCSIDIIFPLIIINLFIAKS